MVEFFLHLPNLFIKSMIWYLRFRIFRRLYLFMCNTCIPSYKVKRYCDTYVLHSSLHYRINVKMRSHIIFFILLVTSLLTMVCFVVIFLSNLQTQLIILEWSTVTRSSPSINILTVLFCNKCLFVFWLNIKEFVWYQLYLAPLCSTFTWKPVLIIHCIAPFLFSPPIY